MRFCGCFWLNDDLAGTENGPEAHRMGGQSLCSTLLPVDHADGRLHGQAGLAERIHGPEERAAGRDDVLHEAHAIPFDPIEGPVVLCRLAHDQEGKPRGERARRSERDGAELGPSEPNRLRLELLHCLLNALAERRQQVRPRLEAILVEGVPGASARPEDEIALEVGVLAERELQLVVGQAPRAWLMIWRARGSSRSAPGVPFVSDSIEPSSK